MVWGSSVMKMNEGWTPVIGWHKVPTCLLRLRASPHVCETLPSSDSSRGRPLTRTALSTFLLMFATHLTVENQASGLQLRALPVRLPFHQELDLNFPSLPPALLTLSSPPPFLPPFLPPSYSFTDFCSAIIVIELFLQEKLVGDIVT